MKLLSADTVRRCFVADPGYAIITADYNQVEIRIAAALAGEQSLIEAAKRGESLLKIAAARLFGENYTPDEYRYTKNVTYGWLYGGGAKTLSEQAGIPIGESSKIIKEYQEAFPALTRYKKRNQDAVLRSALSRQEYDIYRKLLSRLFLFRSDTLEGRKARLQIQAEINRLCARRVGFVHTPTGRRLVVDSSKPYVATNYIIQGFAADTMKEGFLRIMDDPELEPTVLLLVHDEVLGQAPIRKAQEYAERYAAILTTEYNGVPLTASGKVYGKSWGHGYRK